MISVRKLNSPAPTPRRLNSPTPTPRLRRVHTFRCQADFQDQTRLRDSGFDVNKSILPPLKLISKL